MAHPPSISTREHRLRRAELSGVAGGPRPDGTISVWMEGDAFRATGVLRGSRDDRAVLFVGPDPFSTTFAGLGRHLAKRGVPSLTVVPVGPPSDELVHAAIELLMLRGVERVSLASGGDAASAALAIAPTRAEIESVTLFSPTDLAHARADRLRGRPLRIYAGDDAREARALGSRALPAVEVKSFRLAGAALGEVTNDLAADWVPTVISELRNRR